MIDEFDDESRPPTASRPPVVKNQRYLSYHAFLRTSVNVTDWRSASERSCSSASLFSAFLRSASMRGAAADWRLASSYRREAVECSDAAGSTAMRTPATATTGAPLSESRSAPCPASTPAAAGSDSDRADGAVAWRAPASADILAALSRTAAAASVWSLICARSSPIRESEPRDWPALPASSICSVNRRSRPSSKVPSGVRRALSAFSTSLVSTMGCTSAPPSPGLSGRTRAGSWRPATTSPAIFRVDSAMASRFASDSPEHGMAGSTRAASSMRPTYLAGSPRVRPSQRSDCRRLPPAPAPPAPRSASPSCPPVTARTSALFGGGGAYSSPTDSLRCLTSREWRSASIFMSPSHSTMLPSPKNSPASTRLRPKPPNRTYAIRSVPGCSTASTRSLARSRLSLASSLFGSIWPMRTALSHRPMVENMSMMSGLSGWWSLSRRLCRETP